MKNTAPKNNQANTLKAKIHIAKAQLHLDDATYRDVLVRVTGKDSSSKMTIGELERVIKEMKRLGFKPKSTAKSQKTYGKKPNAAKSRKAMTDKIEAILADMGLHWNYAHAMARRMFGVDQCHWLCDDNLYKLVQALAVYQERHANGGERRKRHAKASSHKKGLS